MTSRHMRVCLLSTYHHQFSKDLLSLHIWPIWIWIRHCPRPPFPQPPYEIMSIASTPYKYTRRISNQLELLVNFSDADVTFLSSDLVAFRLHRKYLEATTGGFPGAEFETQGELVRLTEPSSVLEVMFQFVYPRRHPRLDKQDFDSVLAIAEAVEKYEVFSAMNTCETRMM